MNTEQDTTSLGELIIEIKSRATQIFIHLWNQDYSALESKYFGISMIDILGFAVALFIIYELFKFAFTIFGELIMIFSRMVFTHVSKFALILMKRVFTRIRKTLAYLWEQEPVRRIRYAVGAKIQRLLMGIR